MIQIPIDKSILSALRKALSILHEHKPHLQYAIEAGVDVSEEAARADHLEQAIMQFLKVYEPLVLRNPGRET